MKGLTFTRGAKRELAQRLTSAAADMVAREYGADVEVERAAATLVAQWLKDLPGDGWDIRLPQPQPKR